MSSTNIPMYYNLDATGSDIMLQIQPGQLIGGVADIRNGPDGVVIDFVSDAIDTANMLDHPITYFIFAHLPFVKPAGAVKFQDLQTHVTDAQLQVQQQAIKNSDDNGMSLANSIKKVAQGAADVVTGSIPWGLVAAATGVYILTHWKEFFKPAVIRK